VNGGNSNKKKVPSVGHLLANWPDPLRVGVGDANGAERSALDWDEAAETIQAKIEAGSKADETSEISTYLTDEEIFSPPAGQTDKDGHNTASTGRIANDPPPHDVGRVSKSAPVPTKITGAVPEESKMSLTHEQRERDRKSLQDLARLAQMTPAPSSVRMPVAAPVAAPSKPAVQGAEDMLPSSRKEEDSGLVNFAAFSAAPSAPASQRSHDQVVGAAAPLSVPPFPSSHPAPHSAPAARVSTPASQGLFDDEPLSGRPPSVAPSAPPVSGHYPSAPPGFIATLPSGGVPQLADSVRPPVSIAVPQSVAPQQPAQQKKKGGGAAIFAIGTVVALAAVAAGGFFVVRPMMQKRAADAALAMNNAAKAQTQETAAPTMPETRWQDSIAAKPAADPTPAAADTAATTDTTPTADPKPEQKVAVVAPPSYAKKSSGASAAPVKDNKAADKFVLPDEPKAAPPAPPVVAADPKKPAAATSRTR